MAPPRNLRTYELLPPMPVIGSFLDFVAEQSQLCKSDVRAKRMVRRRRHLRRRVLLCTGMNPPNGTKARI